MPEGLSGFLGKMFESPNKRAQREWREKEIKDSDVAIESARKSQEYQELQARGFDYRFGIPPGSLTDADLFNISRLYVRMAAPGNENSVVRNTVEEGDDSVDLHHYPGGIMYHEVNPSRRRDKSYNSWCLHLTNRQNCDSDYRIQAM
ncbi:hypothetical protein JW887_06525 [Candidatus Dojkabacteria bacterium]|nr:hypothetical protein [Candidatus Dojkabacteria bacterium]